MGLALVVLEEHARRTVELGHDDPFGAVDDQGAGVGHERDLAHVHLLLAEVPHAALLARAFLVEQREPQAHAERRRVGETPNLALLHVEDRVLEAILQELKLGIARVALDRKHRLEGGLQPDPPALGGRDVRLQEVPVRVELRREEERNLEDARALAEVVADALLFGEGIGRLHGDPVLLSRIGLACSLLARGAVADRLRIHRRERPYVFCLPLAGAGELLIFRQFLGTAMFCLSQEHHFVFQQFPEFAAMFWPCRVRMLIFKDDKPHLLIKKQLTGLLLDTPKYLVTTGVSRGNAFQLEKVVANLMVTIDHGVSVLLQQIAIALELGDDFRVTFPCTDFRTLEKLRFVERKLHTLLRLPQSREVRFAASPPEC